ncbi:MAG: proline racemase family protein [Bacteroidales bacterium]
MFRQLKEIGVRPGPGWQAFKTIDMHTGGEPLRILTDGCPDLPGSTLLEKRRYFRDRYDVIRKQLLWEPRGHADMVGAVLTPPCGPDSDFGAFFLNNQGYSPLCGHAILALAKFVLDLRVIRKKGSPVKLTIDVPAGTVTAVAYRTDQAVRQVAFRNVPSFVLYRDELIDLPEVGRVSFDVAFGGAFFVMVEASSLGLDLEASEHRRILDLGVRIRRGVMNKLQILHPFEEELGGLYGTLFTGKSVDPTCHSRNVCVFADGQVDRSPSGSALSARAALHHARGEWKIGQRMRIEGLAGSSLEVEIGELATCGPHKAVIPLVSGESHFTGSHSFWVDPADPLFAGFFLR